MYKAKALGQKLLLVSMCAAFFVMAIVSQASAAITIDAKDFTEPVESGISSAAPILIAFIAAVFTVTFVIKWIQRRASSAK
jgi:hypothetical protein